MADRLFLAIPIDEATQATFEEFKECFAPVPKGFRWIDPKNWHITLLFLGDVSNEQYPLVINQTRQALQSTTPLTFQFDRYQLMFKKKQPNMVWARYQIDKQLDQLVQILHQHLGEVLELEPLRPEYIPHVTLARIKRTSDKTRIDWQDPPIPPDFTASKVILFQSQLTPQGAIYTAQEQFKLD